MKTGVSIIQPHHQFVGDIPITPHNLGFHTFRGREIPLLSRLRINLHQDGVFIALAVTGRDQITAVVGPAGWPLRAFLLTGQQPRRRAPFQIAHPEIEDSLIGSQIHKPLAIRAEIHPRDLWIAEQHLPRNQGHRLRRLQCEGCHRLQGHQPRHNQPAHHQRAPAHLHSSDHLRIVATVR